ncbi:MAG: DUF4190 domain-containing protein [Blastocatellia bacterium]
MSSQKKICHQCAMPLNFGVAVCSYCGATVGTLFSEADAVPRPTKGKQKSVINAHISYHDRIEKAQERANNSLILGLTSFLPFLGVIMGVTAIALGAMAATTLKAENVEDGRGSATAGLIIGVLGMIAQGGYLVYAIKSGNMPFLG